MATTSPPVREYPAPSTLGLETRDRVRRQAIRLLDELPEGNGQLVIDLAGTTQVDSAGLGALMLVQRHAAERRLGVTLRHVREDLRFLLALTKLDDLFAIES